MVLVTHMVLVGSYVDDKVKKTKLNLREKSNSGQILSFPLEATYLFVSPTTLFLSHAAQQCPLQ